MPKGDVGPRGAAGPQGADGIPGPMGSAGPQGIAGPEGPAGVEGPQGPIGPRGCPGPVGPMGPAGDAGATGPTGPQGAKGSKGSKGDRGARGPAGSSTIAVIPFASGSDAFHSETCEDGTPSRMGAVSWGDTLPISVRDGMNDTLTMPGHSQCGATIPVHCTLDTLCVTVGNPPFNTAPGQAVHAFAMLATAEGDSQRFTPHPETRAEVVFDEGMLHPEQVNTARVVHIGHMLNAQTRYIVVCGHYTTGEKGATSCDFTFAGALMLN